MELPQTGVLAGFQSHKEAMKALQGIAGVMDAQYSPVTMRYLYRRDSHSYSLYIIESVSRKGWWEIWVEVE